jgi:major vault protein
MSENVRERDLVLAPNEFAFILDETKGHVIAYVGPHKTSLANTDRPVAFDEGTRRYRRCNLEEAIRPNPYAEEGWYVVLENPAPDGNDQHPHSGPNSTARLTWGRKVNIPGPSTFPLWPGQVARVVAGHYLRSNQYLVVKVYNEEAARDNWAQAVIKPQKDTSVESDPSAHGAPDLTLGQLLVIKGTEVSFYIPPTGIEVLRDETDRYIRDAVTLERLEYCILLDEDGNKRYIEGPAVVFPRPTERFVERGGHRKFKAIELNEISGLYIKVIAPYVDDQGVERKIGEELFLTGKDQMIYFPRPEHALIRYADGSGGKEIHNSVAIPAGQARYVLNRLTGEISLKMGPCMFLPDPRREVLVRRVLSQAQCELMYPGNEEVLEYNRRLMGQPRNQPTTARKRAESPLPGGAPAALEKAGDSLMGDDFMRSQTFTEPRQITLDPRFEGAVTINIWTGYAVLLVSNSGARRVVVGPAPVVLQYDETLEAMELSTGTPKTDEELMHTVYLRAINNKVSDLIEAETRDLCNVNVRVSYRVNFEGDPDRWFNVENYVKFLTDHLRSVVRSAIKRKGIEEFHNDAIAIVRDAVLGASSSAGRTGRNFEENGMRVYDVDILDVGIGDEAIAMMFQQTQHEVVRQAITLAQEEQALQATIRTEQIKQDTQEARFETFRKDIAIRMEELGRNQELVTARIQSEGSAAILQLQQKENQQPALDAVHQAEMARSRSLKMTELELAEKAMEQRLLELAGEVKATVDKAGAISPDLIAALQSFSDRDLAGKMAQSMAPLAILGGSSVSEVLQSLLRGTALEGAAVPSRHNGGPTPLVDKV